MICWQGKRRRIRSQPFEANLKFDQDLQLALLLSKQDSMTLEGQPNLTADPPNSHSPSAKMPDLPEIDTCSKSSSLVDIQDSEGLQRAGSDDSQQFARTQFQQEEELASGEVSGTGKNKSNFTPGVPAAHSFSACETMKKSSRFGDGGKDINCADTPVASQEPSASAVLEQVQNNSRRKVIEESDEEQLVQQPVNEVGPFTSSKSGTITVNVSFSSSRTMPRSTSYTSL